MMQRYEPKPWDIRRCDMVRAEDGEYVRYDESHAEIKRLREERDVAVSAMIRNHQRAEKAEAERDAARSMMADAERDMRQRAAKVAREAWRDGYDATPHILALPLKHADRGGVA